MESLIDSLVTYFRNRTSSAFIGTFVAFWSIWHWQFFVTLFFVDQDFIFDKYGMLKSEYINRYSLGFEQGIGFYLLGIIVPLVLTICYIWLLPRFVLIRSYKVEMRHKTERKVAKATEDRLRDAKLADLQIEAINEEKQVAEKVEELKQISPEKALEQGYEADFKRFKTRLENIRALEALRATMYAYKGYIDGVNNSNGHYEENMDMGDKNLSIVDVNGLINFVNDRQILLTEKGRYFLRQLINDETITYT